VKGGENGLRKAKQNALPLEEQRTGETPKESLSAPAENSKAEGDAAYLALAQGVASDVVKFVSVMNDTGMLECLINCDDYGDDMLTFHIRRLDEHLRLAAQRAKAMVKRLELLVNPVPFEPTDKEPE
jgi:hypothetical protein